MFVYLSLAGWGMGVAGKGRRNGCGEIDWRVL